MIYVLDNYYAIDHLDFCRVIDSDKNVDDIVEICSAVTFLFEDLVDVSACLDMDCLSEILCTYYGAHNIKKDIPEDALKELKMPIGGIFEERTIKLINSTSYSKAYLIDLYEARDSWFGPEKNIKVIKKWLPEGDDLEKLKRLLIEKGEEK